MKHLEDFAMPLLVSVTVSLIFPFRALLVVEAVSVEFTLLVEPIATDTGFSVRLSPVLAPLTSVRQFRQNATRP